MKRDSGLRAGCTRLLTMQTGRSLRTVRRKTLASPTREDSPPSNGRIQHPWDVCGTKNQSPIVVIPHSCGQREADADSAPTTISQNLRGRTSGAVCPEREPPLCHLSGGALTGLAAAKSSAALPASGGAGRWPKAQGPLQMKAWGDGTENCFSEISLLCPKGNQIQLQLTHEAWAGVRRTRTREETQDQHAPCIWTKNSVLILRAASLSFSLRDPQRESTSSMKIMEGLCCLASSNRFLTSL